MFNIDYKKIWNLLLLIRLRKEELIRIGYCLSEPIISCYNYFNEFRNTSILKATYNSQMLSLQTYLRNYFGTEHIWLLDAEEYTSVHVYNSLEGQDLPYVYNTGETPSEEDEDDWIYNTEEDNDATIDGIVRCASFLQEKEPVIKAIMRQYIFADKQYNIEYI